jgi:hypothetical protein
MVGRLNCCWSSPAQSFLSKICDQDFCSLLHMYVFTSGASSFSVDATFVAP